MANALCYEAIQLLEPYLVKIVDFLRSQQFQTQLSFTVLYSSVENYLDRRLRKKERRNKEQQQYRNLLIPKYFYFFFFYLCGNQLNNIGIPIVLLL